MKSADHVLTAIQRSADHARRRYPHDSGRRLEIFVAALSGSIGGPLIDRTVSDLVFNLLSDTITAPDASGIGA